jgi:hypothetical protein
MENYGGNYEIDTPPPPPQKKKKKKKGDIVSLKATLDMYWI